jgi:uncharacterized protein
MRAVDTNILVYAEILTSAHHRQARDLLASLAQGARPWAIPWPCIYEFLRVVTHPKVFHPPVPLAVALRDLAAIFASPSLLLLAETERHADTLNVLLRESPVTGNLIHDAHVVALCIEHGVSEIITGDSDFARFKGINVVNPFRSQ